MSKEINWVPEIRNWTYEIKLRKKIRESKNIEF